MSDKPELDHVDRLNRAMPANKTANLGTIVKELIDNHNALLVKLDADVNLTDDDYAATLSVRNLGE